MTIIKLKSKIPFMADKCDAARGGQASLTTSIIPFGSFDISFIGTGTAKFRNDVQLSFLSETDSVDMEWTKNQFIGHHWLLGDFKIELDPEKKSMGKIEKINFVNGKYQAVNTNEFYFRFNFSRFNNLSFKNEDPIINSSIIFDVPPTAESVFKLTETSKTIKAFRSADRPLSIKFNYCDISLYPEKNIDVQLASLEKIDERTFRLSIKYTNLTSQRVTCAYFLVLHDNKLITKNDYGFKKVKKNESFIIDYLVSHEQTGITVELPVYGGVYLPKELRGSKQIIVQLQF